MAVITIPSSFSPIAAALDAFTQDRLAQQKRARQQEQDAWNREARGRQRQGWTRQDQMQGRQDLLWQRQQDEYNKARAKEAEMAQMASTWTPDTGVTALTGMIPEQVATGRVHPNLPSRKSTQEELYNALATHQAKWPGAAQISPSGIAKLYGPQQEATSFREFGETLEAARSSDPQQRDLALFQLMKPKQDGGYGLNVTQVGMYLMDQKETFSPPTGTERDELAGILYNPAARHETPIETMGTEMYDEDPIEAPITRAYTTEERLQAVRDLTGEEPGSSVYKALYKPEKQAKPSKPFTHWQKAYGHSGGQVQTGDVMNSIEAVMKEALLDNFKSSDYYRENNEIKRDDEGNPTQIQPFNMSELFSAVQEEELMSNMWQAAQMIQRQYFPMKTPQTVFQEMKQAIGTGPNELDLINTTGTMAGYEELGDHLSRYLHTPKIYSTQQIIQDYLETLGHKDLTNQLDEIRTRHN